MSEKKTYKEMIDAELDLVQVKITELKAQRKLYNADIRNRHARHVENLEHKLDQTRAKLQELEKADEHVWEQLKDGVENMWTTLQSTLEDTVATFKEEEIKPQRQPGD